MKTRFDSCCYRFRVLYFLWQVTPPARKCSRRVGHCTAEVVQQWIFLLIFLVVCVLWYSIAPLVESSLPPRVNTMRNGCLFTPVKRRRSRATQCCHGSNVWLLDYDVCFVYTQILQFMNFSNQNCDSKTLFSHPNTTITHTYLLYDYSLNLLQDCL